MDALLKNFKQTILRLRPAGYKQIARNTALLFGLQAIQSLMSLVSVYFLVRFFDQTAYGEYNLVLNIINTTTVFVLPGMGNAIMQSVSRNHKGTYRAAIPLVFLFSLLGSVCLTAAGLWFHLTHNASLSFSFYAAAALFPFAHGLKNWRSLQTGTERFGTIVKIDSALSIITVLLIVTSILNSRFSILQGILIILGVQAVANIFMTTTTLKSIDKNAPVEKESISYGMKTSLYTALATIANYLDKILIFFLMSPSSLAIYVAAEKIPNMAKNVIKNLGMSLAPRFAKHKAYTKRVDDAFKLFSIIVGIAIILFSFTLLPWLVIAIFGETYRDSLIYAQALMCSLAIANTSPLRLRFINSQPDAESFRDTTLKLAGIKIFLILALVPIFKLNGAVLAVFLTRVINVIIIHNVIKKRYPIDETADR